MKFLWFFVLVALLLAPGLVLAGDTTVTSETNTNLSQGVIFNNNQKNNISISSIGNFPYGQFPNAPEFPPAQYRKETPNSVIFSNLPSVITREIIRNYRGGVVAEKGEDFLKEMGDAIKSTPVVFQRFPPTAEITPFPGIPPGLTEGRDYARVAVLSLGAQDKIPSKWDFAMLLSQKGMDIGADLIIPINESSNYVFKNKAGAFSLFGAFAQIFASTPWGANISPGGGFSSGSGEIQTLPSMTVAFVKILDPDNFWAAANKQFAPKKAQKVSKLEIAKPNLKPIPEKKEKTELEKIREEIGKQNQKLLACPFASPANAELRNKQGRNYLTLFVVSQNESEKNIALDLAFLNFSQALRDGPPEKLRRDAYEALAVISLEKSKRVSGKRKQYLQKTLKLAKKARIEIVPTPSALVKEWKEK
ncbi:MAG: hypothetical protein GXP44_02375 [bacterium]|nr:hypothetical protein [bacterium]